MKKPDIVQRSANDNCWTHGVPAINVKWYPYLPEIETKFRGVQAESPWICKVCGVGCSPSTPAGARATMHDGHKFKGGGEYFVHEYGDDAEFWAWFDRLDENEASGYRGEFGIADEMARESGWEDAHDLAAETFSGSFKVYSSGRSSGWLVVHGLEDIESWDAVAVTRWGRFARGVTEILDDMDYRFLWNLAVNVFEARQESAYEFYRRLSA